jgi:hypothetical protein
VQPLQLPAWGLSWPLATKLTHCRLGVAARIPPTASINITTTSTRNHSFLLRYHTTTYETLLELLNLFHSDLGWISLVTVVHYKPQALDDLFGFSRVSQQDPPTSREGHVQTSSLDLEFVGASV